MDHLEIAFLGEAGAWQDDAGRWRYVVDKAIAPHAVTVKHFAFQGGVSLYEERGRRRLR